MKNGDIRKLVAGYPWMVMINVDPGVMHHRSGRVGPKHLVNTNKTHLSGTKNILPGGFCLDAVPISSAKTTARPL